MDDAILYMSDELKLKAFERNWARLETSTRRLNLDALRLCVRLLPEDKTNKPNEAQGNLRDLLLRHLQDEQEEPEYLYQLAEACTQNESFAVPLFLEIHAHLTHAAESPTAHHKSDGSGGHSVQDEDEQTAATDEHSLRVAAYLRFLKYSFWLPSNSLHVLQPHLPRLLLAFVGTEGLTDIALDAVSALLSLLGRAPQEAIRVANLGNDASWLRLDSESEQFVLRGSIIDQSFWTVFKSLGPTYFEAKSSKLFKVWFQWISQAMTDGIDREEIYEDLYWERVRIGMLNGFADQRKYCLGILRASLLAARKDITTHSMCFQVERRDIYLKAYDRYFVLYETVVLDRYANQIEACLPELSALFGSNSVVSAPFATALLSSGLDPQVQEGIRKIVGNWYFGFISGSQDPLSKDPESLSEHTSFLTNAYLPWATLGSLFTSTLKTTRSSTECLHGAALVRLVARFVASAHSDAQYREELLVSVLNFILGTGGKIFQMSTLYMLEGLIKGFDQASENGSKFRILVAAA